MHLRDCSKNIIESLHCVNAKKEILQQMMKGVRIMQQLLCVVRFPALRSGLLPLLKARKNTTAATTFRTIGAAELGFSN
jgi:hypothetical protein